MTRISYGDQVKERARRLLEALLAYADGEFEDSEHIDIQFKWQSENQLVFKTKLRVLESLTAKDKYSGSLTKDQIRESLNRMQGFLEILKDNRTTTQGSENWHFTLKLWHKNKETNLSNFDREWNFRRPEKSKQASTKPPLVEASEQSQPTQIPHNLPQPDYGKFIGREEELDKAMRILRPYPHSQHSLVTIDGVGGIGKSALALEISHRFLRELDQLPSEDRFEVLVWTSAKQTVLRPGSGIVTRQQVLRTLDDICEAVALTLSIEDKIRSHPRDKVGLIRRYLVQQRTLLVVDNLETVDDEAVIEFLQELPAPTKAIITTRHRIDVAYPVRLVGMKWEESKILIEQECLKKEVELTEEQKRKLHDRTGGLPLAIVWSIAEIGFGHSIDSILVRLGNPKGDIARFCFESVVDKIRNRDAYKLLLALALCGNTGSREELGYVAGFDNDLISKDEGLVELEKLSLVNKKADRFSILPLTREYAEHELVLNSSFTSEAVDRLIYYHLKRNLPSIASTHLVNHKSKLSKDNLEKFLDEVVEQFWSEASAHMNDNDMYYSDRDSLGSYVDGICFQCIKTMEAIGGMQGIQKLKKSWVQIWGCDQFISYCSGFQGSSPIQDCINSLERLGEYEFLIEILASKNYRAYANEILQAVEKSGKKDLVQPLKNILNTESDDKIVAKFQQAIKSLE
jgi:Effector-associated domain 4/NB-ARC domain